MNRFLTGLAVAGICTVAYGGTTWAADAASPNAPQQPTGAATTGQVPQNTLMEQRQGAISGGTANQDQATGATGNSAGASAGSAGTTGQVPNNTLMEQRQGAISGKTVPQGGGNKQ